MPRPPNMARGRIVFDPGSGPSTWTSLDWGQPIAAPADRVAELLGVTVEEVHAAGMEPYIRLDGKPVWSVNLVGVALGLRLSRVERQRKRNGDKRWRSQHAAG